MILWYMDMAATLINGHLGKLKFLPSLNSSVNSVEIDRKCRLLAKKKKKNENLCDLETMIKNHPYTFLALGEYSTFDKYNTSAFNNPWNIDISKVFPCICIGKYVESSKVNLWPLLEYNSWALNPLCLLPRFNVFCLLVLENKAFKRFNCIWTRRTSMSMYRNPLKRFASRTEKRKTLNLEIMHWGLKAYEFRLNDYPRLTFGPF